jgi:leader peptidase (prepilin peptidase)/N-methyltransferase
MLPDCITLPLLWIGLLVNLQNGITPLPDAVIGAIIGYMSLWSIFWIHKFITGKSGLGYGDFKLLAALGAWLGWAVLPLLVVIASGMGLIFASIQYYRKQLSRTTPLPLGSFLALAGGYLLIF